MNKKITVETITKIIGSDYSNSYLMGLAQFMDKHDLSSYNDEQFEEYVKSIAFLSKGQAFKHVYVNK